MVFELKVGEEQLVDVRASLFRGIELVEGRLKITNRRVLFEPTILNVQRQTEEIPFAEIVEVGKRKTMRIVPNGMLIRTKLGVEYKFVVWGRDRLIGLIQKYLSQM